MAARYQATRYQAHGGPRGLRRSTKPTVTYEVHNQLPDSGKPRAMGTVTARSRELMTWSHPGPSQGTECWSSLIYINESTHHNGLSLCSEK